MLANKILSHYQKDHSILVIDLGGSFKKNINYHSGRVIESKINPMSITDAGFLAEFIISFIDREVSNIERGEILERLNELNLNEMNFNQVIHSLEEVIPKLRYYFTDFQAFLTDDPTNFNKLNYADLNEFPENIRGSIIIYLLDAFKRIKGQKLLIIDECWSLLESNATYISECFRTFRKYAASAVAISQSISDFTESSMGRAILKNSYHKFIFKQDVSDTEYFNHDIKERVNSISSIKGEYSEFLYLSDIHKKIIRYYPSELEMMLFNTERAALNRFNAYEADNSRYMSYPQLVHSYMNLVKGVLSEAH